MQTQTLPIQVSGASASPAPQRANGMASSESAQFSQTLSREMEQRQGSPAPAAARQAAPAAKPQAAPAPNSQPAQVPAQAKPAEAHPGEGKPAAADAGASADQARDDAADAAAASPVADMLALVASFNQPVAATSAPAGNPLGAAAQAAAALQGADLRGYAGMQAKADVDPATIATAARAQALAPAADDTGLAFKDVAQAIDGAARLSMKALAGDAEPKGAEPAAPRSILQSADAPRAATAIDSLTARAGAAQEPDLDGAGAAAVKTEAPPKPVALQADAAQPAPLRAREAAADVAVLKDAVAAAPVAAPLQQASLAIAQPIGGVPTDRIAARLGTPGWDNQLGQKIIWMVAGKEQSAALTLNPPDMGPMQVVLSVTNDQATVTFSAAQPEVRQALENAMPKLREMLGESGIALGNATVNDGMPDQRQAQQGEQQRGQGTGGRLGGAGAQTAIPADTPRQARPGGGVGLVDTFA